MHCMGSKEATAAEYGRLFEWLVPMTPQDFFHIVHHEIHVYCNIVLVHVDRVLFYFLSLSYTGTVVR